MCIVNIRLLFSPGKNVMFSTLDNSFIKIVISLSIPVMLLACNQTHPISSPSPTATRSLTASSTGNVSIPTAEFTSTPSPSPTILITPTAERTLTICTGAEPDTLYLYSAGMLAGVNILEAVYDGPIDSVGFSYQPVILEKLPSLADGDASLQSVSVKENDFVVNDSGDVVLLRPGVKVRPFGCSSSECAITWQGGDLQMPQLSATFTLLPGLLWSDGQPLTADDSLYGYEVATSCRAPDDPTIVCGSLGANVQALSHTASYTALDDLTTRWVGFPGFLDQTYMTNFAHPLPRHQLQKYTPPQLYDAPESSVKPMGWGPYIIQKWQYGEYIRLVKNPYYFRADEGLPYFDELVFRFFGASEDATYAALAIGTCDLVDQEQGIKQLTLSRLLELAKNGQLQAIVSTGTSWEHLDFNIQPPASMLNSGTFAGWDKDGNGQGPFGDVRLRQAIAMCLNRQKVVDDLFYGLSPVLDTYLPPNHPLFNTRAAHWPYDPVAAGALLDQVGWLDSDNNPTTPRIASGVIGVPDGTPLEMNLQTTMAAIRQQVFEILSDSLAACGIQANLLTYESSTFFDTTSTGIVYGRLFDLVEYAWLTGAIPPCDLFISNQIPTAEKNYTGSNNPGFSNPAYDAACNLQLGSLPGGSDYTQAVMDAQRIFADQLPVIPLFLRLKYAAARPDMCGYSLDPTSLSDFWNIEEFDYGAGCR
jgi:peptide/nickel transport system substrate-binding protein